MLSKSETMMQSGFLADRSAFQKQMGFNFETQRKPTTSILVLKIPREIDKIFPKIGDLQPFRKSFEAESKWVFLDPPSFNP